MVRIPLDSHNRRFRYLAGTLLVLIAAMLLVEPSVDAHVLGTIVLMASLGLFSWRNILEVNPDKGRLAHRVGFLYPFVRSSFHLDSFKSLALTSETRVNNKGNEVTTYQIRVGGMGGGKLCKHSDMWALRHNAEKLCRALGVDMENRLLGGVSVRKSDELDVPLAERWRLAGMRKEAPRLAQDSPASIEHGESFSEFSVPVEPIPRATVGIVGAVVLAGLIALYHWTSFPLFMLLIFGGATLFFSIGFILQHTGRNCVRFTGDIVEFRRGKFSRRSIPIAGIEEILASNQELALMSDQAYLVIDRPKDESAAQAQREFVERQIAQRQTGASTASG